MFPSDGLLLVPDTLHLVQTVGAVEGSQLAGVELVEQFEQTGLHLLNLPVCRQLGGLSLPGLLPLLSLLLLLVGGGGEAPAGQAVSGPGVVEGQADAVVAATVISVRFKVVSLLVWSL